MTNPFKRPFSPTVKLIFFSVLLGLSLIAYVIVNNKIENGQMALSLMATGYLLPFPANTQPVPRMKAFLKLLPVSDTSPSPLMITAPLRM